MHPIEPEVWVASQIAPADLPGLAAAGVRTIVCNRPDGEERGQPAAADVAAAAAAAGIAFVDAPFTGGFGADEVAAMLGALAAPPVVAYCKSGMRSAALWAAARASAGGDPVALIAAARATGHELGMLAPLLMRLRASGAA